MCTEVAGCRGMKKERGLRIYVIRIDALERRCVPFCLGHAWINGPGLIVASSEGAMWMLSLSLSESNEIHARA